MSTCSCSHCQEKDGGGFMSGVFLGMMVGAALTYVYAVPDGRKKAQKLVDESTQLLKNMGDKAGYVASEVREFKKSFEEQIREAAEEEGEDRKQSFVSSLQKRFFQKNGKKLS